MHNGKTIILPERILGVNPPILVWGNAQQAAWDLSGFLAASVPRESQGRNLLSRLRTWITNKRSWYFRGGLMASWSQEQVWQSEVGSWAWKCTGEWGQEREKLRNCPKICVWVHCHPWFLSQVPISVSIMLLVRTNKPLPHAWEYSLESHFFSMVQNTCQQANNNLLCQCEEKPGNSVIKDYFSFSWEQQERVEPQGDI